MSVGHRGDESPCGGDAYCKKPQWRKSICSDASYPTKKRPGKNAARKIGATPRRAIGLPSAYAL